MTKKRFLVIIFIMIAMVLTLAGCGGSNKENKDYEKPVHNYFEGMEKGDLNTYEKAFPSFVETYMDEEKLDDLVTMYKDEYGEDFDISYNITNKKELNNDDFEDAKSYIKEEYDQDVNISGGYELEVEATMKGSKDSDTIKTTMYVFKINDVWYCMESSYGMTGVN